MREFISGAKLSRLATLFLEEPNKKRLIETLKQKRLTDVIDAAVQDTGATHFEYYPVKNIAKPTDLIPEPDPVAESLEVALKRPPMRIAKSFVEAWQEKLTKENEESQTPVELDFDSAESKIELLEYWIETKIKGENTEIDPDIDTCTILNVYGTPQKQHFLFNIKQAGLIADNGKVFQKRLTLEKVDVTSVIDEPINVPGNASVEDIKEIILDWVNDDADDEECLLFPEDLSFPMTHYTPGTTYRVQIRKEALDLYGYIEFVKDIPTVSVTNTSSGTTVNWAFGEAVLVGGTPLQDLGSDKVGLIKALFNSDLSDSDIDALLVPAELTVTTTAMSATIVFGANAFDKTKFEELDTDTEGKVIMSLGYDDGNVVTVSGKPLGAPNSAGIHVESNLDLAGSGDDYQTATATVTISAF